MDFKRIRSDINGNPRHVIHFLTLEPEGAGHGAMTISERYQRVIKAANKLGGRKYHNKSYGGGVVFQAYECELPRLVELVRALVGARQI